MYEQLNIFSFLEPHEKHNSFNPIEEFAKEGSVTENGKKRIIAFFTKNENLTDRANFLKNEYGVGGFTFNCDKPFIIHYSCSSAKGCYFEYYNENMENIKVNITFPQLANTIDLMIEESRY